MKILTENKGIILAVTIFIVAMFIYNLFFKSEGLSIPNELEASSIGNDLLMMHESLKKVTFDQTIFSSPGYLLLTDFNVEVPQQTTGRTNPFNIIGQD